MRERRRKGKEKGGRRNEEKRESQKWLRLFRPSPLEVEERGATTYKTLTLRLVDLVPHRLPDDVRVERGRREGSGENGESLEVENLKEQRVSAARRRES
jgi:hypothetical protein